jgi:F-type H+-transporting ATPase subunit c
MKRVVLPLIGFAVVTFISLTAVVVNAQQLIGHAASVNPVGKVLAIAAALTMAVAAFAGTFAQGKTAASALEGIARNPDAAGRIVTPMIIAMTLIESIVIFALLLAFYLQSKI